MWLSIDQGLPTHRKVWHLERLLQVSTPTIVGHLVLMWLWALDSAADGRIQQADSWAIEKAAGWTGAEGAFVAALLEAGLLDGDGAALVIHNWEAYGGKAIAAREKDADRKRKSRGRHADVTRTSDVDKTRQDRQENIEETRQDRATVGLVSFQKEKGEGSAVERAALALLQFPQWTLTPIHTRHLLQQLAFSYPEIDLEWEVGAWRSEVLERREPIGSCEAVLRGWMAKARPMESGATSRIGEW